jgi:CubicO group peptidase (beta-lactamase class C family)
VVPAADPLASYDENRLYADLVQTKLIAVPGEKIHISEYGSGLLAHVVGRKIGATAREAIESRIVKPLALTDTFFTVPPAAAARRAQGTDMNLVPVQPWSWGVLAGAGGLYSSVRDQLTFIEAELDGASGSRLPLRPAMKLTQESQLQGSGANIGLGWQIDRDGRYWHTGTTNGFHAFVGFDVKERRGIVILAASATPIIDQISHRFYKILAGEHVAAPTMPTAEQLAAYAGTYNFSGAALKMLVEGKRLFVEGPGEPRIRMLPISDTEFWIHSLQAIVVFQRGKDGKVAAAVFVVGDQQMAAPRMEPAS